MHGDARYLRKGLAVALLAFLEAYLVSVEVPAAASVARGIDDGGVIDGEVIKNGEAGNGEQQDEEKEHGDNKGKVTLWILAAECINGVYWRKRGFREVRRRTEGPGVWGCKTEFEMVVLKKEVVRV